MSFKENLKYYRELSGLSQYMLGERLSTPVSPKTISSWEVGRTEPTLATVIEIATILNVPVEKLLDEQVQNEDSVLKYDPIKNLKLNNLIDLIKNASLTDDQLDLVAALIKSYIDK